MSKEAEKYLRKKGITGDFNTKRMIPTVEKGELIVDWFQDFADQQNKELRDEVRKLIKLYESIIHGDKKQMGLFDCYDSYYRGCWDERIKKVKYLKKEIKSLNK